MSKTKTAKPKKPKPKMWPALLRLSEDWRARIEALKIPSEPETGFIREILRPILDGSFAVERDAEGRVIAYRKRPASERVELSSPPRPGRPWPKGKAKVAAKE